MQQTGVLRLASTLYIKSCRLFKQLVRSWDIAVDILSVLIWGNYWNSLESGRKRRMVEPRPSSSASSTSSTTRSEKGFFEVVVVNIPPPVPNPKFEILPPRKLITDRKARSREEVDTNDYYMDAMLRRLENAGKINDNFAIINYQEPPRVYPKPKNGIKRRLVGCDDEESMKLKIVWT